MIIPVRLKENISHRPPRGGSEKGDPTKESHKHQLSITFKSIKSPVTATFVFGSPFSDPPVGDSVIKQP